MRKGDGKLIENPLEYPFDSGRILREIPIHLA